MIIDPQRSDKPRQRTLRFRLACLVLACVLPVWVTAAFFGYHAYQQRRNLLEQHVLETSRALSMVVDRELAAMQASATALATSHYLASGDLVAFRRQALEVVHDYPDGTAITLADASGQQVANTYVPWGTPLPKHVAWNQAQRVFETGKPVIINLFKGALTGRPVVGIAVPVISDGRTKYVLAITAPSSRFEAILSQQRIPPEWSASVLDADKVIVARNRFPERYVGRQPFSFAMKQMSEHLEGTFEAPGQEGLGLVVTFSRSSTTGWIVVIGIPKVIMLAGLRQWLWWTIGGAVLLSMIGIALALFLARQIAGSIRSLIAPASALGSGEPIEIGQLDLKETNEVGQSLVKASQLLQQRTAERERAEQASQQLAAIVESSDEAIIGKTLDGTITSWNRGAQQLYGYTAQEVLGRHISILLPQGQTDEMPHLLEQLRKGVTIEHYETLRQRKDGTVIPVLVKISPIQDTNGGVVGASSFAHDITERKRAEEALRQGEERWSTTLRSIGDAVISTCAQGKIIFMNEVAEKLTGWPLSEAQGRDLSEVFSIVNEMTRIKPESPVSKVIRMGQVVGLANHTALIRRDGTELPIEDSGAPIRDKEGQVTGVVLVFHDISEKRKAEKAVRDSERLAMTGRMASTLAHEIHNPLDTVGSLLYLIEQDADAPETVRQRAAMASEEVTRVTQMTRHMLAFQRESSKPVPIKIEEVLDNVTALYERKIESAAIKIEKQVDFEGEFIGLPGEMRQVIANLMGNAIEAIGKNGKIRLHAYASTDWRRGRRGLRVTVADNGPGIPAEVRDKIFDPFFTTKGEAGTGLGLWIIAGIIENNDGMLRFRTVSRDGRSGTCFSVFFPFPS
jgi:PAS domain S-box-containing protein